MLSQNVEKLATSALIIRCQEKGFDFFKQFDKDVRDMLILKVKVKISKNLEANKFKF